MSIFSKTICLLLPLLLYCTGMAGQAKKGEFWSMVNARVSAFSGAEKKHMELTYTTGYNITDRFSVGVSLEDAVTLFNLDGKKDHYMSPVAGGMIGYDLVRHKKTILNVCGGAGATLDNQAWKYVYYDASIGIAHPTGKVVTSVSYGCRYYDTMGHAFANHCRFYVAVGCLIRI